MFLQATDFLFQVFSAAVVSWGDHVMPLLLGIRSQWFPWQPDSKPQTLRHSLYGEGLSTDHALPQCLLAVPYSLPLLLDKAPWSSQAHKVSLFTRESFKVEQQRSTTCDHLSSQNGS